MDLADISVATISRVQTPEEERVVVDALTRLAAFGMPIAVADRASRTSFIARIESLQNVSLIEPREPGLVGQVQASVELSHSMGRPFILYTEPDKHDFFNLHLAEFMRRARGGAGADIVIAARSAEAFATFPPFQQSAEQGASSLCATIVGSETDYFYGPFLFRRDLAGDVRRAPATLGWGWRPFLFATVSRNGGQVASIAGDYVCPEAQREESDDDKAHRLRQFGDNVRGLIAALLG